MKSTKLPSRDAADLAPGLRTKHDIWLTRCRDAGVSVLVTCTWRSLAEQRDLYARGRTTSGKIVTWTLNSKHCVLRPDGSPAAEAFDFVPLVGGKPVWMASDPLWERAGEIAEGIGLEWGGRWSKRKRDLPHIQLPSLV